MSVTLAGLAIPAIIEIARRVGAPMVEKVLGNVLGDTAGDIAGTAAEAVLGRVAEKAGVEPGELHEADTAVLESAVKETEPETPELILAHVEQQRETNRLLLAEMDKGAKWTWAWRPATMWGLLIAWAWYVFVVPLLNLVLAAAGAAMHVVLLVDISTMLTITGIYTGLYMGGHTLKELGRNGRDAVRKRRSGS